MASIYFEGHSSGFHKIKYNKLVNITKTEANSQIHRTSIVPRRRVEGQLWDEGMEGINH